MPKSDPKKQNTGTNQQAGVFVRDIWTVIIRNLTAREQTSLRRVSKSFLGWVNDTDKALAFTSGYGRLLMRFRSPLVNQLDQPVNARTLSLIWQNHFRFKLKPIEVDFFTAVICGDVLAVERLLRENRMLIALSDNTGSMALHFAAIQGDVAMLDCLYAYVPSGIGDVIDVELRGPDFDCQDHLLNVKNILMDTPLFSAVRAGKRDAILWFKQKLQNYIDTYQPHAGGMNRMDLEVRIMAEQLIKLPQQIARCHQNHLLDEVVDDADITAANQAQDTLLHEAAGSGNVTLLRRFLANPAYNNQFLRRNNTDGSNVFHRALQSGHVATINLLLEKDEGLLDTVDLHGRTALSYAIKGDNLAIVKEIARRRPALLQRHYPTREQEINNSLANIAIRRGNLEIFQFLIEKGVALLLDENSLLVLTIRITGHSDRTSREKKLAIIRYLINHFYQGVQQGKYTQSAVDKHYSDALRCADLKNDNDIIPLLIDAGAIPAFESYLNTVRRINLLGQRILPSPEIEKARKDYKDKLYYSRWLRGLLWLGCLLLMGAIGLGATALVTWVAMPLALNIAVQVVACLAMLALAALSNMALFKMVDDSWNFPFFSRVRLKPFAPISSSEEAAVKAKVYYPSATEAKAPAAVKADPVQAASQNPDVEPIQSEGEREAAMPALALNA